MTANIFLLIIFLIFSFGYTLLSFGLDFGTFSTPGAGMLPIIVGVMATLLSSGLLIYDIKNKPRTKKKEDGHPLRALWYIIDFVIYVLIFIPLGYVISTMLFVSTLFLIMNNKWYVSLIAGVATGIAFYIAFSLLQIPLPQGILENIQFLF